MDREDFEIKFADFCETASEQALCVLMRGLLSIDAGSCEVKYLANSYYQRFGWPISLKELTSSANEVS